MDWREAFISQAQSDFDLLQSLSRGNVAYAHRLHYLQMSAEKLAKAVLTAPAAKAPPEASHAVLVRMLQTLKGQPGIRRALGFDEASVFRAYIDSLLDLAGRIEQLAPALAKFTQPNPEYPWRDHGAGDIVAPCGYDFPEFDPTNPKLAKMHDLIRQLLRVYS